MKNPAAARCLVFAGLFAPSVGLPQQKEKFAETKSVTILPSTDLSKEAVVYEQVRGHLRYDADGSGSNVTYARIRVQSYAGVQRVGQLIFNYDSANAQLEVRLIRVTKSDGKIVVAGPEAIQDMTSPIARLRPLIPTFVRNTGCCEERNR
jgi:hypothetical protein